MSFKQKIYSSFRIKNGPGKEKKAESTPECYDVNGQFNNASIDSAPQNLIAIEPENVETEPSIDHSSCTENMLQQNEISNGAICTSDCDIISDQECPVEENSPNIESPVFSTSAQPTIPFSDFSEIERTTCMPNGVAMDPLTPTALAVSTDFMDRIGSGLTLLRDHGKKVQKYVWKNRKFEVLKKSWKSVVNIVLVEARDLPDSPESGPNCVYCKFRLGSESHKSRAVPKTARPSWRERFNLHVSEDKSLELSVWHKGRQKNFMGRLVLDLSLLERERTHDLWQELEGGFGAVHLLVTLCPSGRPPPRDNIPTTNGIHKQMPVEDKFAWYRLADWHEVGQLSVTVHGARGLQASALAARADAYCVMELDNSRVQTHTVHGTSDPVWDKNYTFAVNDITSTLEITVYDESIYTTKGETLGKISIPLLRVNNEEKKWYALKDRAKRASARGNCPRILLEMTVIWNPIKASARLLSPKETKYVQKPPKFDIPLIYSNLKFVKDIFSAIAAAEEYFRRLFEWENREKSALALLGWLVFWYCMRLWLLPLLLLTPFVYNWTAYRSCNNTSLVPPNITEEELEEEESDSNKDEKTIKTRIYGLQDLTFTIKNGIDYIVSLLERLKNLANFTVPYLSFVAMIALAAASVALYTIPVNYLFMAAGIYKFTRKFIRPERIPNNDILDFISRIPDNEILKEWRELKVPEPNLSRAASMKS